MTPEKIRIARVMYDSHDYTVETIASTLGVSRQTIYRHLEQDRTNRADEPLEKELSVKVERKKGKRAAPRQS